MSYYPHDLKIYWDYGEAHHFKGPHDGIGGTVKRKVYRDVTACKVIIKDAKHFADYANTVMNVRVEYLDKSDITLLNLNDAVYIYGTLQIHHLERVSQSEITFYYNSPYKQLAHKLRSVNYAIAAAKNSDCDTDSEEIDELVYENLNR